MGLGVAILFHLVLYIVLATALTLASWLARRLLKPRSAIAVTILSVAPFVLAALPIALFAGAMVWNNVAPPRDLYRSVFGRRPGPAVVRLAGWSEASNDSEDVFLSFAGSDAALHQALGSAAFELLNSARQDDRVPMPGDLSPPAWWRAGPCVSRTVYLARKVRGWDDIVVISCRSDGTTYVQARWLD